jgi:uncharacterized OsmC-like protein
VVGEIELDDGVLVIRRIHVRYVLRVTPDADRSAVDRAMRFHPERCPVYRSVRAAIDITTSLDVVED